MWRISSFSWESPPPCKHSTFPLSFAISIHGFNASAILPYKTLDKCNSYQSEECISRSFQFSSPQLDSLHLFYNWYYQHLSLVSQERFPSYLWIYRFLLVWLHLSCQLPYKYLSKIASILFHFYIAATTIIFASRSLLLSLLLSYLCDFLSVADEE